MKMDNDIQLIIFFYICLLGINETAYALNFEFEVSGLSVNDAQKNQAYDEIQKKINNLVSWRGLDIAVLQKNNNNNNKTPLDIKIALL